MRAITLAAASFIALVPFSASAEQVSVNGIELHYTSRGSGEPLVLLHGFGSCAADWGSLAEKLALKHEVITVDARGHGRSTNPSEKFSHAQAAEDVHALLKALGIPQVRALGFSSGGITLLHLATRHPESLSKMVVVGATNHFPEDARAILKSAGMDSLPRPVLAGFRECATRGEKQVESLVGQFRALGFSKDDTDIKPPDLAKIEAKTLIVHGDGDMFFPVSIPAAIYQAIPDAALWIVPNGDHSPTAGADEAAFVSAVEAFMSK